MPRSAPKTTNITQTPVETAETTRQTRKTAKAKKDGTAARELAEIVGHGEETNDVLLISNEEMKQVEAGAKADASDALAGKEGDGEEGDKAMEATKAGQNGEENGEEDEADDLSYVDDYGEHGAEESSDDGEEEGEEKEEEREAEDGEEEGEPEEAPEGENSEADE